MSTPGGTQARLVSHRASCPGARADANARRSLAGSRLNLPVGDSVVGGDWHDTVPLSGGRAALIVGDVMGHGPEAAAVMVQLRTAAHTLADLELPGQRRAKPHVVSRCIRGPQRLQLGNDLGQRPSAVGHWLPYRVHG
jgi:hypothetical protein